MFRAVIFILSLLTISICEAAQRVPVMEGTEVTLTVSHNALNRIAVAHDRIITVKGITDQFELDKDTELGQVFIKPIAGDKHELIHLFLVTEKGHTYPLSLTLKEGAAESILLIPLEEKLSSLEQSTSFERLLKTHVQAMVNQTNLEGFVSDTIKSPHSLPKIKETQFTLLQAFKGHPLEGQVFEVLNLGKEELLLTEPDFYQPGVRAVAILNPFLAPKTKTRVYVVRG